MNKYFLFIIVVILSVIIVSPFFLQKHKTATIRNHTFIIEVAKTPSEKAIGLAKYNSLPENKAMYFPFDTPGIYTFWMKNMRFPIDIIFLKNKKIVTIFYSVPNPSLNQLHLPIYQPIEPSDGVLEINAGLSRKYGFKIGDIVDLRL